MVEATLTDERLLNEPEMDDSPGVGRAVLCAPSTTVDLRGRGAQRTARPATGPAWNRQLPFQWFSAAVFLASPLQQLNSAGFALTIIRVHSCPSVVSSPRYFMDYDAVIGLEAHVQLKTQSKM